MAQPVAGCVPQASGAGEGKPASLGFYQSRAERVTSPWPLSPTFLERELHLRLDHAAGVAIVQGAEADRIDLVADAGRREEIAAREGRGKMQIYCKTGCLGSKKNGDPGWGPPLLGGSAKAPRYLKPVPLQILEDELSRDRDAARTAGEHLRRLVVHRRRRNRKVVNLRAGESDRTHVTDVAANVLGVV